MSKHYPLWSEAEINRNIGMRTAEENAGKEWNDKAYAEFVWWLKNHSLNQTFLLEDFRRACEHNIPIPPTKKAWGPVVARAHRKGLVEKVGFALAESSNLSPKVLWKTKIENLYK